MSTASFDYKCYLQMRRSIAAGAAMAPKDDIVDWLFIELRNKHRFGFRYKIIEPSKANYDEKFIVYISIFLKNRLSENIIIGQSYNVWRGEEPIGEILIEERLIDNDSIST